MVPLPHILGQWHPPSHPKVHLKPMGQGEDDSESIESDQYYQEVGQDEDDSESIELNQRYQEVGRSRTSDGCSMSLLFTTVDICMNSRIRSDEDSFYIAALHPLKEQPYCRLLMLPRHVLDVQII